MCPAATARCAAVFLICLHLCCSGVNSATLPKWKKANAKRIHPAKPLPPEGPALDVTIVPQKQRAGVSSQVLGINMGHRALGTNAWHFMRRLGVNGARVFLYSTIPNYRVFLGKSLGRDLEGRPVNSEAAYVAAVAQLRTPEGHSRDSKRWTNPIRYTELDDSFARVDTAVMPDTWGHVDDSVAHLNDIGVQPMGILAMFCEMCRDAALHGDGPPRFGGIYEMHANSTADPAFWGERWELYKVMYYTAQWTWSRRINRIELYNEPELELCWGPTIFVQQTVIRSMAVQEAYHDLNTEQPGQHVDVMIVGPGIVGAYYGPDDANAVSKGDFGSLAVKSIHQRFPLPADGAAVDPAWRVLHGYSYHSYNKRGWRMLQDLEKLRTGMAKDIEAPLPVVLSEYNLWTNTMWDTRGTSADTPSEVAKLGGQLGRLLPELDSIYLFKFSQMYPMPPYTYVHGVQKNGIHYGDNDVPPYDLADSTRLAEAYRLVSSVAAGGKPMYAVKLEPAEETRIGFAVADDRYYHLFIVNEAEDTPLACELNLRRWNVLRGAMVVVSQVSTGLFGDVATRLQVPLSGEPIIRYRQPPASLVRYAIPRGPGEAEDVVLRAAAAATVEPAARGDDVIHDSGRVLRVGTSPDPSHRGTAVAIVRFNLGAAAAASVRRGSDLVSAVLQVHIRGSGTNANNILQVLGVPSLERAWRDGELTWNSCGALLPLTAGKPVARVSDNFISWHSDEPPVPVGHISVAPNVSAAGGAWGLVDVLDYVRQGYGTFMIVRPHRFNGNAVVPGDNTTDSGIEIDSRDAALQSLSPALKLHFVRSSVAAAEAAQPVWRYFGSHVRPGPLVWAGVCLLAYIYLYRPIRARRGAKA